MLTVDLMELSGALMGGTSLLVATSTTKTRMKGLQARRASAVSILAPWLGFLAGWRRSILWPKALAEANVTTSETTEATTMGRSAPATAAVAISGMAMERPESRVSGTMPRMPLGPLPTSMTMRKGVAMTKGAACRAWVRARLVASRPVMEASVVVGMPMEPNMVGTPLARRHTSTAFMGSKPRAIIMEVGMATAVPKPAMPSRKPPKHQPMRSASTRWWELTEVSMTLMVSMAPVWTVTL